MFCEKCGTKLEEGSLFCDNCGAKIADMAIVPPVTDNVQEVPQEAAQVTPQVAPQGYGQTAYQQMPQGYQQPTQGYQPMSQGYQPVATAPKQPMTLLTKIFIIEVAVLFVMIIVFFKVGQTRFGSDYVAENYARAKMAGDWEAVYDMLNLPGSPLLTEEMFMATRTDEELLEIANYEIEENLYGNNNFSKSYVCEYMTSGNSYSNSETIVLVKQRDKKWLFFDKWEVTPDNMLIEDVSVTIPNDATLIFDGVDVSGIAGVKSEEYYGETTYRLPKMFMGTHNIEVQAPGRKTYSETVDIEYYFSRSYTSLEPDIAVTEELVRVNEELCSTMWAAIMEGKSYDDFYAENSDKFVENVDFKYYYENWLYEFESDEYYQYNKITVDEMEARISNYGTNYDTGEFYVTICQEGTIYYEGTQKYTNWWTDEVTYELFEGNWGFYEYATFTLRDGKWVITYFGN